ncbi:hypothetical protein V8E52_003775 [Russula decolorans]
MTIAGPSFPQWVHTWSTWVLGVWGAFTRHRNRTCYHQVLATEQKLEEERRGENDFCELLATIRSSTAHCISISACIYSSEKSALPATIKSPPTAVFCFLFGPCPEGGVCGVRVKKLKSGAAQIASARSEGRWFQWRD